MYAANIPGSESLSSILESNLLVGRTPNPSAGSEYSCRQSGHLESLSVGARLAEAGLAECVTARKHARPTAQLLAHWALACIVKLLRKLTEMTVIPTI